MSFFYNLNNKLNAIRDLPSTTHGQLNEGVVSELKKSTVASYAKKAAADAVDQTQRADGEHEYGDPRIGQKHDEKAARRVAGVGKAVDRLTKKDMDEGLGDMARKVGSAAKKLGGRALNTLGHGDDADMIRDLQKKMGVPQTGEKPNAQPKSITFHKSTTVDDNAVVGKVKEAGAPMSAKQKSFAALAEPKDKITFADKIAGAKKEVDEMLGDVAAEAMKQALGGGKKVVADEGDDNSPFTAHKRPRVEKPAVGTITRGSKHDVEEIPGGRRVTRRVDPSGISVGADDDKPADGEKRGRGRPKGPAKAPERVTGGATKHKGGRKMAKEGAGPDDIAVLERLMDEAFADGNNALGNALQGVLEKMDSGEKQVDEKAVSKKQQRFMGMVHAAQKGEKPASKEVAKTAKGMGKKDAEDFAATKHKGLPEKKKSDSKKEKTEETADSIPSKGGMKFGGGIYDSMNRELENMIAESMARLDESMSINMSMNNDGDMHGGASKSLTVTATDEDAMKLSQLLKSAGLGGGDDSEGYGGSGYQSACGCGTSDCSCGEEKMDEVSMNQPDYPTETETSGDALQYAGGLNKPKATGQTTTPVIASQDDRQHSYAEAEEDALHRMMEMAGVKKKEVDEEKTDEGNKFTGNLAKARADGKKEADLDGDGDMEKVRESIFDLTNQWKAYKG
jgi:hypothetical protein